MNGSQNDNGPLWVFAYGSLIWRPGFAYLTRKPAWVSGYRRSFCMRSVTYRGTHEAPGLVLALDKQEDSRCDGVVYEVANEEKAEVLAYLRERELEYSGYEEVWVTAKTETGDVPAVTYVIDPENAYYAGGLSLAAQAEIIARSSGKMGPNAEYLDATVTHLNEIGCPDPDLQHLAGLVAALSD